MAQQGNYTGEPLPFMIELTPASLSGSFQIPSANLGGLLKSLWVDTDDTADGGVVLTVEVTNGSDAVKGKHGVYIVPALAGTDGVEPQFNLYEEMGRVLDKDNAGNPLLELPAEYKIKVTAAAITADKKVYISGQFGTYKAVEAS
jgi:hypothetical protein